jgi:hypothetical protein
MFSVCCSRLTELPAKAFAFDAAEQLKPLAYWRFDGDDEHLLLDETERYVGLSQGGAKLTAPGAIQCDRGRSITFDGDHDCVVVRHNNELLLNQGTVACWFRADDVNRSQGILSKDASGFGDGGHLTMSLDDGKIVVRLQSTTESYEVRGAATTNRWTHVAFMFGNEGMRLFVNGELTDSNAYAGGLGESSGGSGNHEPLVFGASTMTSQAASETPLEKYFVGELDEIAIFARQLTANEITELVNAAKPQYTSLVRAYVANRPAAWWRLNEPVGTTVALDQVGRQHGSYNVVGSSYFDGDDFVDVGALDLDDKSFTILALIKPNSFGVSGARIIAKDNGLNEEDQFWSLSTTIREDQPRLRFRLRTEHGTREAVSNERNISVNEQVFVAAVYDGHVMRLYQDGELVGEVAHHGKPKTNAHVHVWIGDSPSGAGKRPFGGEIKDVAILNAAISPDHIRAIYLASRERAEPLPPVSPLDLAATPTPIESLPPVVPRSVSPAVPFIHRCPLCDVHYRDVPIYRVQLPETSTLPPLPYCDAFQP